MFEQIFKNIDGILRKDAGCSSELDYTEQSSWLLFLKYIDDLDEDRKAESSLTQKLYHPILDAQYRWGHWAVPKDRNGDIDENKARTGDILKEFVNSKLFPYLKSFKDKAESSNTIHYKIGEIFSEIQNKIQKGFILRDILDLMDKLRFRSQKEKFELSVLYEAKIKRLGNAGPNGGVYYTPRPLIRAIFDVVKPRIGETVYDGAAGSAGFLCEAYNLMCNKVGIIEMMCDNWVKSKRNHEHQ
jgi:type I restriction enzyme M protein